MTIINSEKTLICLRNACHFIGALAAQNGRFLFVNTNPLFDEIVEQMTRKIGTYTPNAGAVWRKGGFLTNIASPKKFRSRKKKIVFSPSQPPDCVVIMDSERKSSVILEAHPLQIPVVALVDPSTQLDWFRRIAYPVPANDSAQFVYLFCNMITKTILLEQKRLGVVSADPAAEDEDSDEEVEEEEDNEDSDEESSVEAKSVGSIKSEVDDQVTDDSEPLADGSEGKDTRRCFSLVSKQTLPASDANICRTGGVHIFEKCKYGLTIQGIYYLGIGSCYLSKNLYTFSNVFINFGKLL